MKDKHNILGVHITDRLEEAVEVQRYLTEYGRFIRTRLGLHDVAVDSPNGLLLLELVGLDEKVAELSGKLNALEGVETQLIVFEHE